MAKTMRRAAGRLRQEIIDGMREYAEDAQERGRRGRIQRCGDAARAVTPWKVAITNTTRAPHAIAAPGVLSSLFEARLFLN